MNKSLLIMICTPTTDGFAEIASGYPVGRGLVLTARHVLFPKDRDSTQPIRVRWHYHGHKEAAEWFSLNEDDLILPADDTMDVALLRLPDHDWRPERYGFLSEERPQSDMAWESEGFPHVARRKEEPKPASFGGKVYSKAKEETHFEMEETAHPDREAGWKGVSGMPVFVRGKILGIVKSIPEGFKAKRLHAVPAWQILQDKKVREALGFDERQARLDRYRSLLHSLVSKHPDSFKPIASSLSTLKACSTTASVDQIIEGLLAASMDEVIDVFWKAYDKAHQENKSEQAEILSRGVRVLLPALYDFDVLDGVKKQISDTELDGLQKQISDGEEPSQRAGLVAIPAHLGTVAEIIMAGLDKREARFRPRENAETDYPVGEFSLPLAPEGGIDSSGSQAARDLQQHLAAKFTPGQEKQFRKDVDGYLIGRFYKPEKGQRDLSDDQKMTLVADYLADERKDNQPTFYFLFRLPKGEEEHARMRSMVEGIARDYSAIKCLSMNDTFEIIRAEHKRFNRFRKMLPLKRIDPT